MYSVHKYKTAVRNTAVPDCRKSLFFQKKCLFSIPNPKPLPRGKGLSVGLPPSPRLGLRPKPHIIKNIVYRQSKRGFIPLLLRFYPFLVSFRVFLSSPFPASAFSASEAVYRPPHRPHRIYSGILAVSACLYAFYRNTTS